jgi:hypothetical protein
MYGRLQKWRGAHNPTLEKTLVAKSEEAIAGCKLAEASEEGQGPRSRAVEPVMMMMRLQEYTWNLAAIEPRPDWGRGGAGLWPQAPVILRHRLASMIN